MKKITIIIGLITFALIFQHCKNNSEQQAVTNNETETILQQEDDKTDTISVIETKDDESLTTNNEAKTNNNNIKPIANTTPKTVATNTNVPKIVEVKTTDTSVPKVEEVATPKEVVVVKETEPIPNPVVEPKVIVENTPTPQNQPHWTIPVKYNTMKNPINTSADGLNDGKDLWQKECKSCHGTKGLGDGPKAEKIDISCGNFSSKEFQSFTDGELFYITTIGRKPMPSFKEKLDDNEVWLLVNYMRTFKK